MSGDRELSDSEKLAMFRERVEAYNRDGAVAFENENPDLVLATAAEWPGGGAFRGLGAVMEFLRQFGEAWEEIRLEPGDVSVVAGRLLFPARWVARGQQPHRHHGRLLRGDQLPGPPNLANGLLLPGARSPRVRAERSFGRAPIG